MRINQIERSKKLKTGVIKNYSIDINSLIENVAPTRNFVAVLACVFILSACTATAIQKPVEATDTNRSTRLQSVYVETHPSQGPQRNIRGSSASITATTEGAALRLETNELTPSNVYTLWVVAINAPENCASSPCTGKDVISNHDVVKADVVWGDGAIADKKGVLQFTAWAPAGEWKDSWFGHGLRHPTKAEIHLVINDHGPAQPGQLHEMLTSYRGGCTDKSLPPPFPDVAKSDGPLGPNTCALRQDAIFSGVK